MRSNSQASHHTKDSTEAKGKQYKSKLENKQIFVGIQCAFGRAPQAIRQTASVGRFGLAFRTGLYLLANIQLPHRTCSGTFLGGVATVVVDSNQIREGVASR